MTDKCNSILEEDALESLRRLNQGQRRAVKTDPGNRCGVCARPIFMSPGSLYKSHNTLGNLSSHESSQFGANVQVWGHNGLLVAPGSVVIFSSKQAFHRPCFNLLHTQTILASSTTTNTSGTNSTGVSAPHHLSHAQISTAAVS